MCYVGIKRGEMIGDNEWGRLNLGSGEQGSVQLEEEPEALSTPKIPAM